MTGEANRTGGRGSGIWKITGSHFDRDTALLVREGTNPPGVCGAVLRFGQGTFDGSLHLGSTEPKAEVSRGRFHSLEVRAESYRTRTIRRAI